jgi:ubiquinone biosynthesis monooxygenase Coq7
MFSVLPSGHAGACPAVPDAWPRPLWRELRTDHAGEAGAVMIYRGILAVSRDPRVRAFARVHLETEARHLALIEAVVPPAGRSRLLPLWRVAGWLTGALPALAGARAVYATIAAVETFVDAHYAAQTALIDRLEPTAALGELRALLESCREDEVHHRDDARAHLGGAPAAWLAPWLWLVAAGSSSAVRVSRRI